MSEAEDSGSDEDAVAHEGQADQTSADESIGQAAGGRDAYVLDASALLCLINGEPGADRVATVLPQAVISAVSLAQVAGKLGELGADAEAARALLAPLHLTVVPLDEGAAYAAGALRAATHRQELPPGDRAALALAAQRGATALTANRAWHDAGALVGVTVELLQ